MFSPLHAILDIDASAASGWEPAELAKALLDGGATVIQLRAKRLPSGRFLELCDHLVHAAQPYDAAFIVNDRADLALMSGAAGVHVGQDDLEPQAARELLSAGAIVGQSTHTLAQVEAALAEPVSYIAVGPVFGTTTKATGYERVGLELVADAARLARRLAPHRAGPDPALPIVAIGGITLETAPAVIAAGASAVAVIADLLVGGSPAGRVAAYLRALGR